MSACMHKRSSPERWVALSGKGPYQPLMTPPQPAWYWKGSCQGSLVAQNFLPVCFTTPVACTTTVAPLATVEAASPSLTIS